MSMHIATEGGLYNHLSGTLLVNNIHDIDNFIHAIILLDSVPLSQEAYCFNGDVMEFDSKLCDILIANFALSGVWITSYSPPFC